MNLPLLYLLIPALLLAGWLTWLAVRRADRRRLFWRIFASCVAIASLVLLLKPPYLTHSYNASEAILLTQGYAPDSLQTLLNRLQPRPQVFSFGIKEDEGQITDFSAFREEHPRIRTLHVLGNGLPQEETPLLDSVNLVPHLSPLPMGLLSASWPQEILLGEEIQVQGTFWAPESATWLYLKAAGKNRDSVQVKKGQQKTFSFRFKPKAAGTFVYALQWKDRKDSLMQEQVPFTVLPPRTLNVLVLSSTPSFEVKFLKNALAKQGHGVAVRSEVSKGLYQTEQANLPVLNLHRLTPALLQRFDVVLQDEATLKSLNASERQALQQAVKQQELGVLTSFSGSSTKTVPFFGEARFQKISQKQAINAKLRWEGGSATLDVPPVVLSSQANRKPLVWTQSPTQALVTHYRKGLGQVGMSLVGETFPLVLSGDSIAYQQYWATILTELAKPQEAKPTVQFASLLPPRSGQPLELVSSAQPISLTQGNTDSATVPAFAPSTSRPATYSYQVPTLNQGWHTVQAVSDSIGRVYVHAANAWQTQVIQQQQHGLSQVVRKSQTFVDADNFTQREPMPIWPFFLLFLCSVGFLWLEEKL